MGKAKLLAHLTEQLDPSPVFSQRPQRLHGLMTPVVRRRGCEGAQGATCR